MAQRDRRRAGVRRRCGRALATFAAGCERRLSCQPPPDPRSESAGAGVVSPCCWPLGVCSLSGASSCCDGLALSPPQAAPKNATVTTSKAAARVRIRAMPPDARSGRASHVRRPRDECHLRAPSAGPAESLREPQRRCYAEGRPDNRSPTPRSTDRRGWAHRPGGHVERAGPVSTRKPSGYRSKVSRWFSDPPMWLSALAMVLMVALAVRRLPSGLGPLDWLGGVVLGSGAALIAWDIKQRLRQSSQRALGAAAFA